MAQRAGRLNLQTADGSTAKKKPSPRGAKPSPRGSSRPGSVAELPQASNRGGTGQGAATPRKSLSSSKPGGVKPGDAKAASTKDAKGSVSAGGKSDAKSDAKLKPSASPLAAASTSSDPPDKPAVKTSVVKLDGPNAKKIEFYTEELLSRKPLDEKARDALVKKCGPPKQEVNFERNENHWPAGRPDELTPSRHERVPPTHIVLMFNCFEASFTLIQGDLSTLPESDTSELRSLTSGKVLGRVKVTPEKGTPMEDRVEFNNEWKVGAEHGIVHDGLQTDGYIELRLDWKAPGKKLGDDYIAKVALLRVNPWLAYGCGEGARLAIRKPGATESTASTLQRALRDDYVVVRRDGSDSELTVDPTPFTVVPSSNPRHKPGHAAADRLRGRVRRRDRRAVARGDIDIKDGSRHLLRVEGKQLSGWVTMTNASGSTCWYAATATVATTARTSQTNGGAARRQRRSLRQRRMRTAIR